ncbi:sensor histidine kinase [Roseicyclus elongatus]|uniref:sensor histidine kinase n=1 Tax=Roseicyclus elongatus TaxID=159346 RepID=UPI001C2FBD19|nr:sensor histidine kinase [Roseibacterium elongatum]
MRPRHWARSLSTRLLIFLSIALLPLGVIAVYQTVQVIEETRRLAERDAVSRTSEAADEQQVLLERAFGSAYALGETAANLRDDPATCAAIMADFVANHRDYVFAGFVNADGVMLCNNASETVEFRGRPDWEEFVADPVAQVNVSRAGEVSGHSVYIVFVPIFDGQTQELLGGQAISIPHALSATLFANDDDGLELALINAEGEILAASTGMNDLGAFERRGVVPDALEIPSRGLLVATDARHRFNRPTAVVPLIGGQIYVLGLWRPGTMDMGVGPLSRTVPLFPLLMWLASLAVAYITVNNLILKPLSRLSTRMRRYRGDKPGKAFVSLPDAPSEMMAIAESYNTLLDRVAADTAQLEANVREKETLLREVHHRVKNNLQLISSILNMQMRGVQDDNARRILSRVQDRVMSLSSVHRVLYTDNELQSVRADHLLDDVIKGIADLVSSASTRVEVNVDLHPVRLDPDQAVPLSLLATEAMTNAVKYVAPDDHGRAAIDVTLRKEDADEVVFSISNTRGAEDAALHHDSDATSTGLGARLIQSFASQLGGEVEIVHSTTAHILELRFESLPAT